MTGILAKVAMVTAGTVLAGGMVAYSGGSVHVSVREKKADGHSIYLPPLPALAAPMILHWIPSRHMHLDHDAQSALPALRVVAEQLEDCPDATLVEVESARETVHIAKRGGALVIDVDDKDEEVHVSFPIHTMSLIADELQRGRPAN